MLLSYLMEPATLVAVVGPALITLWALTHSPMNGAQWRAWLVCTFLSTMTVRWELKEDAQQLFILPIIFAWMAVDLYRGIPWRSAQAYAASFLSLWSVDMMHAANLYASGQMMSDTFYYGVGGAGWGDGLFLTPLIAATLPAYVAWRRKKQFVTI